MTKDKKIIIAGSGLVGSLLGLRLLQRGFDVEIYESRPDMRKEEISAGRSINLALSHRGIRALQAFGMDKEILTQAIQMNGRMIHTLQGQLAFQEYSSRPGEFINSISRRTLNIILMDAIEKIKPDAITFKTKLRGTENTCSRYIFEDDKKNIITKDNCILIGADGASSMTRKTMLDQPHHFRFNYSQTFQNYGYKELSIPPDKNNSFVIEKNALHIWPRGHFMMIALPNPDASYTATLFLAHHGPISFDTLNSQEKVRNFFQQYFMDVLPLMPNLETEFFEHPIGHLYTIKCEPWNYEDSILLLGDAAHAIIPFYGQGMNCGFEDVFIFDEMIDHHNDWKELFKHFSQIRKPNADAIADLAEDNFLEMRDKVADPIFIRKRQLELQLEKRFPEYYSKYALVTFRPDISYSEAMIKGRKQDEVLMKICSEDKNEWTEEELLGIYKRMQMEL